MPISLKIHMLYSRLVRSTHIRGATVLLGVSADIGAAGTGTVRDR